jgi:hypothetical protein
MVQHGLKELTPRELASATTYLRNDRKANRSRREVAVDKEIGVVSIFRSELVFVRCP